jgi:hypothetical protein
MTFSDSFVEALTAERRARFPGLETHPGTNLFTAMRYADEHTAQVAVHVLSELDETLREAIFGTLCDSWAFDTHSDPEQAEGAALYWKARSKEVADAVMEVLR